MKLCLFPLNATTVCGVILSLSIYDSGHTCIWFEEIIIDNKVVIQFTDKPFGTCFNFMNDFVFLLIII